MSRLTRTWLFLFSLLYLFFGCPYSYGQQRIVKTFSVRTFYEDNGLSSNHVYATAQSSSGEIWFGTTKGISTFDGLRWTPLPASEDFPFHNRGLLIALPGDSMLQVGKKFGTNYPDAKIVVRLYHEKKATDLASIPIKARQGGQRAFNAAVSKEEGKLKIAIQSQDTLWLLENIQASWQQVKLPDNIAAADINKLVYFQHSLLLLTTHGLYSLHPDTKEFHQLWPTLLDKKILLTATASADGKKLYLLGNNLLAEWSDNRLNVLVENLFYKEETFDPSSQYNIIATQAGLLVFQLNKSLFLLNPKTGLLEPFRLTNSLSTAVPTTIFEDKEQNLWFSTLRGIALLNNLKFATMDKVVGLPDSEISTIFQIDSATVLLGSNLGINILKNNSWVTKAQADIMFEDEGYRIMDAARFNAHQLLIAGSSQGLGVLNEDKLQVTWHKLPQGMLATSVGVWKGQIVVGTNHGVVYTFENGQFHTLMEVPAKLYIRRLFLEQPDKLLLLTTNGMYRYNGSTITHHKADAPQNNQLYSILNWNGRTLLGTASGLCILLGDKIVPLNDSVTTDRPIYALLLDKSGKLWMGTDKGLFVYHKKTTNYSLHNGLVGREINRNALVEMKDGRIWIGTDKGLSIYDPNYDYERTVIPEVQLKDIKSDDVLLTEAHDYQVAHDQNNLEFGFRPFSFYHPEGLVYRYQLKGYDKYWTLSDNYLQNSVRFTNLPPGDYKFAIQARIQDGPWSAVRYSPAIVVAPPYYTSWWFIAAAILGVAFIGYASHSYILHKSNEKRLKAAILEKVNEVEQSQSKFQTIWESMDTGMVLTNKEGSIIMANPSFEHLFRLQKDSATGKDIATLVHHKRFSKTFIKEWYKNPTVLQFEMETKVAGMPLFLLTTFSYLDKLNSQDPLLVIGLKDISEQKVTEMKNLRLNELLVRQNRDLVKKELELASFNQELLKQQQELQEALKVLEARNFELDQFVYKTSHDLRAPIASSIGLLNIMQMEGVSASWPGYISMIQRSLHKQDTFIKAMLNFSKTARADEKPEFICFDALLEQCLYDLQYLPGYEDINKNVKVKNLSGDFYSDKMKINIILSNIISNSIKYRDTAKASQLEIYIETSLDKARIIISDNGIGIDGNYIDRIFNMFFRATERSDGSGLGLYIVKQTVERLGGKIEVTSEMGLGSCFKIVIPNRGNSLPSEASSVALKQEKG